MNQIDYRENAIWTVYLHTNKINGKYYVGITSKSVNERWQNGYGYCGQVFYRVIKKYGWNNFDHEIIAEHLTREEASAMEQVLILKLNSMENGYNMSPGGINQPPIIETRSVYQFDIHGNLVNEYSSIAEASAKLGIPSPNIICSCTGKVNRAGKYIWKYKDEIPDIEEFKKSIDISIYDNLEPIYQFDMNQNFIKEYSSATEANRINPKWYSNSILDSCRGKYKYSCGYIWRFKKDVPDIEVFKQTPIDFTRKTYKGKPVCQYDLNGNLIKEYTSTREAADALNCDIHTITYACSGRTKTGKGYVWKYKDKDAVIQFKQRKCVLQFNLNGELLNEFSSVQEASKQSGYAISSITSACNGRVKSCGGYVWRYKDNYHGEDVSYKKYKPLTTSVVQLSLSGDFIQRFDKVSDAAKVVNRSYSTIKDTCSGKQKTCAGYKWMYEKDYLDSQKAVG